jgi:hypothetical protein
LSPEAGLFRTLPQNGIARLAALRPVFFALDCGSAVCSDSRMARELMPEEKFNAESAQTMVPKALLQGRSKDSIIGELIALDWSPQAAQGLVNQAERDLESHRASPESRNELLRDCRAQMVVGITLLTAGILCTLAFIIGVLIGLGVVVIFTGLIVTGAVFTSRGYARWRFYRRESLPGGPSPTG